MSFALQQFPLKFGIDESYDPKQAPAATLATGENVFADKINRIRKRYGTLGLAKAKIGGGNLSAGKRLSSRATDTNVIDGQDLYAYSASNAAWKQIDRVPNLKVTWKPLIDSARSSITPDCVVIGDLLVYVWQAGFQTGGEIYVAARELSTDTLVVPPTQLVSAGNYPRIVAAAGLACLFYTTAAGNLVGHTLNPATYAISSGQNFITGLVASKIFDVASDGTNLYLVSELAAGANRVTLVKSNTSGGMINTTNILGVTASYNAFCIQAVLGDGRVHVAYSEDTTPRTGIVTTDLSMAVGVGPTTLSATAADHVFVIRTSSTTAMYGHGEVSTAPTYNERVTTFEISTTAHTITANSTRATFHAEIWSKPWLSGGRVYFALTTNVRRTISVDPVPQRTTVIVEIEISSSGGVTNVPHRVMATCQPRAAPRVMALPGGHLPQFADVSAGKAVLPVAKLTQAPIYYEARAVANDLYTIEVGAEDTWRPSTLGPNEFCAGAAPLFYDGNTCSPAGFLHEPYIQTITAGGAGTGSMADGVYQYMLVYEYRDANGILHRSPPSAARSATAASGGANTASLTLTILCTSLSGRQTIATGFGGAKALPVRIAIYRTAVNGSIFYRLTKDPDYNVVFNDPTAHSVTFLDQRNDSDVTGVGGPAIALTTQPQIYTASELDDVAPGPTLTQIVHKGRIVTLVGDRRTVASTKRHEDNPTVAPAFNEVLSLYFDSEEKYALGSLDENFVVFGKAGMDLVRGDGPSVNGDGSWQTLRIHSDIGCSNPRSVVTVPAGLMFQSTRGIELLDRKFGVTFIGIAVQDRLAAFPTITSAVLVADENQVRFTCNAADGLTGIVLVYDYSLNFWTIAKFYDTDTATASVPFVDAMLINGVYTMLTAGGKVYRENRANSLDDGSQFVVADVTFNIITPAGPTGWCRVSDVQILGTSVSNHDLTIDLYRDYAAASEQTKTFLAGSEATTIGPFEKARVKVKNQKLTAIKVRVRDATPTNPGTYPVGTGEGFKLEGLALRFMPKDDAAKASAGRKG